MLPTLRAVEASGGSATCEQITDWIIGQFGFTEAQLGLIYDDRGRERRITVDRCGWARSACKLGGALDSPKPGLFLLTDFGNQILKLPDHEAHERLRRSTQRGFHVSKGLRLRGPGRVA